MSKREERQKYNRLILKEMSDMIEKHPDVRFNQLLYAMRINEEVVKLLELGETADRKNIVVINKFNEESIDTYQNVKEKLGN